ncbi:hypothetical protein ACFLXE_06700 [Chloroflexota bacterium]
MKPREKRLQILEEIAKTREFDDPRFERLFIPPGTNPTPEELEAAKVKCLEERQSYRFRRGEAVPGCALVLRSQGEVVVMCAVDRPL